MPISDSLLKDTLVVLLNAARDQNILINMVIRKYQGDLAIIEAGKSHSSDIEAFNRATEKILSDSDAAMTHLRESGNEATRRIDSLLAKIAES